MSIDNLPSRVRLVELASDTDDQGLYDYEVSKIKELVLWLFETPVEEFKFSDVHEIEGLKGLNEDVGKRIEEIISNNNVVRNHLERLKQSRRLGRLGVSI